MKKVKQIIFIYEDNTKDSIIDPRAAAMLQSRFNSSGVISGLEDFIVGLDDNRQETNTESNGPSN